MTDSTRAGNRGRAGKVGTQKRHARIGRGGCEAEFDLLAGHHSDAMDLGGSGKGALAAGPPRLAQGEPQPVLPDWFATSSCVGRCYGTGEGLPHPSLYRPQPVRRFILNYLDSRLRLPSRRRGRSPFPSATAAPGAADGSSLGLLRRVTGVQCLNDHVGDVHPTVVERDQGGSLQHKLGNLRRIFFFRLGRGRVGQNHVQIVGLGDVRDDALNFLVNSNDRIVRQTASIPSGLAVDVLDLPLDGQGLFLERLLAAPGSSRSGTSC